MSQSINDFIKKHDIVINCRRTTFNPAMPDRDRTMDHFSVVLTHHEGRKIKLIFSRGAGNDGRPPYRTEVLNCLADDAATFENADTFQEWCDELGFETEEKKEEQEAHRLYKLVRQQTLDLREWLGENAYNELLWETERDTEGS